MTNTPKGCCPKCGNRITFVQAAFYGSKQSFPCSNCGAPLKKKKQFSLAASLAGIGIMMSHLEHENIALTSLLILLLTAMFGVSAMFTASIEESAEVFD
ncbi:MAG: hypothetical protein ABJ242_12805 [Marinomonas sp.]